MRCVDGIKFSVVNENSNVMLVRLTHITVYLSLRVTKVGTQTFIT
jgi:hypothetical protein